jgi:hypothetical protein
MDYAARRGYLNIVRWLHENRTEGCTEKAARFATEKGFLNIVQWFQENRSATTNI